MYPDPTIRLWILTIYEIVIINNIKIRIRILQFGSGSSQLTRLLLLINIIKSGSTIQLRILKNNHKFIITNNNKFGSGSSKKNHHLIINIHTSNNSAPDPHYIRLRPQTIIIIKKLVPKRYF